MLHHVSFNARHPKMVAETLAEMLKARVVRPPSPPFPEDSWYVCLGDEQGSQVEIMPWGHTHDPNRPMDLGTNPEMPAHSGVHFLIGSERSPEELQAIAARVGWRAKPVDTGLFKLLKIWVENEFLVEFLPREWAADYRATFGAAGTETLDAKLRRTESMIREALAKHPSKH